MPTYTITSLVQNTWYKYLSLKNSLLGIPKKDLNTNIILRILHILRFKF